MDFVEEQQVYYSGGAGGPPSVPGPWVAQWAEQESTWIYINEETGERSWEAPLAGGPGGYQQETFQQNTYVEETYQQDTYEQDTYRQDTYEQQNEGFAESAAAWTGEKVGEVEYDAHEVKEDVEDIPEDIAGWVGRKVGDVERFGDEVDGAYDVGRAEGRDGW
ncbi:hypothetical protein UA08_00356 [Talaromyces atroroseus]|uniref:WW domain-containing protein n=1 Tax=Talaromyces atroroseus TaxID=1441469 RepID=A0A225B8K0_TALAT|nr:hypothetical protein UA08_00356 [Talaromyces atroroseus]OKL63726.1 hypothetical protein UA08_00356 [Talaromyces atroroseus]